jgi:formylglycine-generating enzyme required for sulfatase activity
MMFRTLLLLAALIATTRPQAFSQSSLNSPQTSEMVLIPAGEYWMGRVHSFPLYEWGMMQRARLDDKPAHKIFIDAFHIDKFEVTNQAYKQFAEATNRKKPWYWKAGSFPDAEVRIPVTNITWDDAAAYCSWAGKRLPTEAEWEKAARGGLDRQLFVWGNAGITKGEFAKAAKTGKNAHVGIASGPAPVGSYAANGYGLFDMAGNVWEWTNDWYLRDYYSISPDRNPPGPSSGRYKVFRGGGWSDPEEETVLVNYRNYTAPDQVSFTIGFRCARTSQ